MNVHAMCIDERALKYLSLHHYHTCSHVQGLIQIGRCNLPPLENQSQNHGERYPRNNNMAISMSRKRYKLPRKEETKQCCSCYTFLLNVIYRIPTAIFLLILLLIYSSSTTIISGNVVHVCVSSRKLNNLYCLSAGAQANFEVPVPRITNGSATTSNNSNAKDISIVSQDNMNPIISTSVDNDREGEVEKAKKVVEELLQEHRSWKSDKNVATCDGRGIYVYDLPAKFNKDLVGQCGDMMPWSNFCNFFKNDAFGEAIAELGEGWYHTHQYSLEPIFHTRVLKYPCRVYNENEAKLFYVPYYGGLDILRWHFKNISNDVKDSLSLDLMNWLESKKSWIQNSGKDHVFVLGKISWDFRRTDSSWGTRLLELDQMQNPVKLLIERQPWHVNDIGIPHPTYFHPRSDDDIINWQLKIIRSQRKSLVSFAGGARPGAPENIRSMLINQCTSSQNGTCRFLNCSSGGCDQPKSVIELFIESEFCLQPPGDSPTRKSVFDSLISGCIPVLFDPFTAYYQYPWHLPEDHSKYSVFIDQEEVRQMKVNVIEKLLKVSERERENMRRYIVYELLPGLVYGDPNSKLEKFQDAFSVVMNNLLERVNRLN